ncbi:MAG: hypothetical protein ABWZ98_14365 [Nakamurella sp.]
MLPTVYPPQAECAGIPAMLRRRDRGLAVRILVDGDPVIVFGRTVELTGTGEVFLEPWGPSMIPVHRREEAMDHPCAVPLTGWPADQVEFDAADPKLVWRVEGTWRTGNTIDFGSRTLVQDPVGRDYVLGVADRGPQAPKAPPSPFDENQQGELRRLQDDGAVLATRIHRNADGEKIWDIVAFDQQQVSRALALRPDQRASVLQAEWSADDVQRTRTAMREVWDERPVLAVGQSNGSDGGPFAFTMRVGWLTPAMLRLYEATPPGLLDLDVWLGPAADVDRRPDPEPALLHRA